MNFQQEEYKLKVQAIRKGLAHAITQGWSVLGHFLNHAVYNDVPKKGLAESQKLAAYTVHRIGCEKYCHEQKGRKYLPGWAQRLIWTFQSLVSTASDVQHLDIHTQYEQTPSHSEAWLPIAAFGLLNAAMTDKKVDLNSIFVGSWYHFNVWTRMGLGFQKGSGNGFETLLTALSIPPMGHTMLNHIGNRPTEWFTTQVAPFLQGKSASVKLVQHGIMYFGTLQAVAQAYKKNPGVLGWKTGDWQNKPTIVWMFYFWQISNAIGFQFIPEENKDRAFYMIQLYHIAPMADGFQQAFDTWFTETFGVMGFGGNVGLYATTVIQHLGLMGKLKDPKKAFQIKTVVESMQAVNDLATTTGNGDIMPKSNLGLVGLIPLFYFGNANLAQGYKSGKRYYDDLTASVIASFYGYKLYFYEQEPVEQEYSYYSSSHTTSSSYQTSSSSSSSSSSKSKKSKKDNTKNT